MATTTLQLTNKIMMMMKMMKKKSAEFVEDLQKKGVLCLHPANAPAQLAWFTKTV